MDLDRALDALGSGAPIVIVDPLGADMVVAAASVTPRRVVELVAEARGIVRVALEPEACRRLELVPINRRRAGPNGGERWYASVEAASGVTTGISAADRACTIGVLADPAAGPEALVSPGHIVPVGMPAPRPRSRPTRAETALELCRRAGAEPAAALCHLLCSDGRAARGPEAVGLASRLGLAVVETHHRLAGEREVLSLAG